MDSRTAYSLFLLFILCFHSKVINGESSVVFLGARNFLRHSPAKTDAISPIEVSAVASVLLGLAPPSTLTLASSSKLNEVLMPNPFDRPRAVIMIEVTGAEGSQLTVDSEQSSFSTAFRVDVGSDKLRVDVQLSDEDEVSLVSLNDISSDTGSSDKELSEFASWLGGSYVEDTSGPLHGELIIPVTNGAFLRLHMSQRSDRKFTTSLIFLIKTIKRAMELHEVLNKSVHVPAELIIGKFDGIKALQDHYGTKGIAQSGLEVFITSVSKIFDSSQSAYQGRIVGVIVHDGQSASETENILHVTVNSRSSARSLEETENPLDMRIAEVIFVRTTLAWITGIILLIATLLGIHFLMNMPITKDTLLYSNVKLD